MHYCHNFFCSFLDTKEGGNMTFLKITATDFSAIWFIAKYLIIGFLVGYGIGRFFRRRDKENDAK